jgi:hypothetical protein
MLASGQLYRAMARASVSGEAHGTFRLPVEAAKFAPAANDVGQICSQL